MCALILFVLIINFTVSGGFIGLFHLILLNRDKTTFSKKAKENMMKRLKEMIPEYSSRINVETFHSFGYRIIRKFNKDEILQKCLLPQQYLDYCDSFCSDE